jgi:periplasmic divalent cation tolerance protein
LETNSSEIVVLVTASSTEEAEQLGSIVVSLRLAACANVVKGIQSIFHWDNKVNVENECLIIMKTTVDRFADLETEIRKHHSYSVPEIIALPIIRGSAAYLEWIQAETHK